MRLIVITQDRLSGWEEKGEIVKGYFNPKNTFDEIEVILLNDDVPSDELVSVLCGDATYKLYNLPLLTYGILLKTLGWRSSLLKREYKQLVKSLKTNKQTVIRAYETSLASYTAYRISEELGCKYAISLHSTPDSITLKAFSTPKDIIVRSLTSGLGWISKQKASKIMAVYSSIIEALPTALRGKSVLVPNAVGVKKEDRKQDYTSNSSLKLVTTGRLVLGKSPVKIIEAISRVKETQLTVIGDGPLRDELMLMAENLGVKLRITFIKAMNNSALCAELKNYDGFIFRTDYNECPKTVIEAALVGLPIICPKELQQRVLELKEFPVITCDDNASGFAEALKDLKKEVTREKLGREIGEKAYEKWAPEHCATKSANLLISLIK